VPRGLALGDGQCQSDTVFGAGAGLDAQRLLGDWEAAAHGAIAKNWFDCNRYLDNISHRASVRITRGDPGPVRFDLQASTSRELTSFADVRAFSRNMQSYTEIRNVTSIAITPEFRIEAEPVFAASRNSGRDFSHLDYNRFGGALGIGYTSPLDNSLGLAVRYEEVHGHHPRASEAPSGSSDRRLTLRTEAVDARIAYNVSVFTQVSARLSYVNQKSFISPAGNVDGLIGEVAVDLKPSEKLSFSLRGGRRLQTQNALFVGTVVNDFAELSAKLRATENLNLMFRGEYGSRRFKIDPDTGIPINATDRPRLISGSATQRLFDRFTGIFALSHERREGSVIYPGYRSTAVTLSLRYTIGAGIVDSLFADPIAFQ